MLYGILAIAGQVTCNQQGIMTGNRMVPEQTENLKRQAIHASLDTRLDCMHTS